MHPIYLLLIVNVVVGIAFLFYRLRTTLPGLAAPDHFNRTDDWIPGPERDAPVQWWSIVDRIELNRKIVAGYLQPGETVEGRAAGFFSPPRREDWIPSFQRLKHPLTIAVTSRRIMLFEVGMSFTVQRYCFIEWDELDYLDPPNLTPLATGVMRFRLRSGREYQIGFLSPLGSEEGMRQERRLADYVKRVAARLASPEASAA